MKKITLIGSTFMAVIALSTFFFYQSCTPDPCKDVTCLNGGTCATGTCTCPTGYEGTDCGTEWRTKFVGSYLTSGSDNSGNTYTNIPTTIASSSSAETKFVLTVSGTFTWTCTTTSSTAFTLDATSFSGYSYTGNGTINGNQVALSINETDNTTGAVNIYTWTAIKQ